MRPLHVLFVCRENRHRSATAERLFAKDPAFDVRSAGTSEEALVRVNRHMLDWADAVFVMDDYQVVALEQQFPDHERVREVVKLDIPDQYLFMDPDLVELLNTRARPLLSELVGRRE